MSRDKNLIWRKFLSLMFFILTFLWVDLVFIKIFSNVLCINTIIPPSLLLGPPVMAGRFQWIKVFLLFDLLSGSFHGIGWLVFSEILYGVRGPCAWQSSIFWKYLLAKMTKNGQKWSKNRVLGLFRKILSLVLSGNGLEWKYLWPSSILLQLPMLEISVSQVLPKILLTNQISVFINHQYVMNVVTSNSDF